MKFNLILSIVIIFTLINAAIATPQDNATQFINSLSQKTITIAASNMSDKDKEALLSELFVNHIDIKWMAKFAAGRYWREASSEEQVAYFEAYKKFLLQSYIPKFKQFNNQKVKVLDSMSNGNDEFDVRTQIIDSNGSVVNITYKVKLSDGNYIIFDIIAEGISLMTTQRADFSSILSRGGLAELTKLLVKKS